MKGRMNREAEAGNGEPAQEKSGTPRKVRILWLSCHPPQERQLQELTRKFGETEIVQISKTVNSAEEVITLMQENKCDELIAVLPLYVMAETVARGLKPICAVMEREIQGDDVIFQHSHFERVLEIYVRTTSLEVENEEQRNT